MRSWKAAASLAILMSLCSVCASADDQERFIAEHQAAFDKVVPAFALATFSLIVAYGSSECGDGPARSKFDSSLAEMVSFQNQYLPIANRRGDPVVTFKSDVARRSIKLIDSAIAEMQAKLADSALRFGCFEAANAFYRQVINYTGDGSEVLIRRAQIGIEDVRDKLRTRPSK